MKIFQIFGHLCIIRNQELERLEFLWCSLKLRMLFNLGQLQTPLDTSRPTYFLATNILTKICSLVPYTNNSVG